MRLQAIKRAFDSRLCVNIIIISFLIVPGLSLGVAVFWRTPDRSYPIEGTWFRVNRKWGSEVVYFDVQVPITEQMNQLGFGHSTYPNPDQKSDNVEWIRLPKSKPEDLWLEKRALGFPFPCFFTSIYPIHGALRPHDPAVRREWAYDAERGLHRCDGSGLSGHVRIVGGVIGWDGKIVFPYLPIWRGLFLDLVIIATLITFARWIFLSVRNRYRRRRNLCVICGYPVPERGLCPECGTRDTQQSSATGHK